MWHILLIDDAEDCRSLVKKALGESYDVLWETTLAAANSTLKKNPVDLILLDVGLPDGDGFQFCAQLQQNDDTRHIPVVLLTGKTGISNKVLGFSVGADDYVEKPFDLLELRARVESKMQKMKGKQQGQSLLIRGNLQINLDSMTAQFRDGNLLTELNLTPLEIKILKCLVKQEGRVLNREQLITNAWGPNIAITDRTVDKHISSLRQKLGPCGVYVETAPGFGYSFSLKSTQRKAA